MWSLLQLHAKGCQAADCPVPRCRELREMRRRQIVRQENQRRAGSQQMLRNQNASQMVGPAGVPSRAPSALMLMPPHDSPPGVH